MTSTTPRYQRIITFILAIGFLASSFGIVAYYIMSNSSNTAQEAAVKEAITKQTNQTKGPKLQGTQLQNYTPDANITALKIEDTVVGTGPAAQKGDTVTVQYTGAVAATGKIFQSSYDSGAPAQLSLNQVIQGWSDGIPGMKVGGTRRLFIPAAQAYGANSPSPDIPANAPLIFDVVLIKVGK